MSKILKYSLEEFEPVEETFNDDYEQVKKSRFTKVKIRLFGDGDNAHTEPVSMEALKTSADSAYDIPLIAELNPYRNNDDFGGHGVLTGKEFSFGFIKESKDNPIVFEKDEETGKIFITLYGLIWKKYFNNIVDIIKNSNDKVEVSVELDVVKGSKSKKGKAIMERFVLNAVTFLGQITTAACQGANAQLCFSQENDLKFIEDKKQYMEYYFSENIKINNSKESAVSGKWTNPRQKLLNPILKASNKNSLLNEAYLLWSDKGEEGITLSDVSYPHHVIRNGELVLHIRGVQSAFSRLSQQGLDKGKARAHLLRHYNELGLNEQNFEDFGLSKNQFDLFFTEIGKEGDNLLKEDKFSEDVEKTENMSTEEMAKDDAKADEDNKEEFCDGVQKMDDGDNKPSEDETKDEDGTDDKEDMSSDDGVPPEKPQKTFDELMAENAKLQAENDAYMEKINSMSDYEDLKSFKECTELKMAQEAEAIEMAKIFNSLQDKGVNMSEDSKNELMAKREEFSNVSAWANFVKAYAFDNCELDSEGIIKMELPHKKETEDNTELGSWYNLMQKFN